LNANKDISEPAHVMSLIHSTGIRPGSLKETGAKVQAFGATTLEGRHVIETSEGLRLQFVGKKGVAIDIPVTDNNVSKMLLSRKKIAGDSGKLFDVTDNDLRTYTKKLNGGGFKPKDFRTLKGTSVAMKEVSKLSIAKNMTEYKKYVMGVAKKVSVLLGNTPSIALKSYINPFVFLPIKPLIL
jgi:DNA topoisomerase IB